jgi:DNA-binding transcriptional regulator YdaS (Cro superfamily)
MRKIRTYLERHGITQEEFAERLECSQSLVSQWVNGVTEITPEYAVKIERETNGELTRKHLLPHLYRGMSMK